MIKRFALPSTLALLFSGAAFADTVAAPETKKTADASDAGYYATGRVIGAFDNAVNMELTSPRVASRVGGPETGSNVTGSLGLGYQFGNGWRAEGEYVFKRTNNFTSYWAPFDANANEFHVSAQRLMLNGYKDFDLGRGFSVYGTLGIGVAIVSADGWQTNDTRRFASKTQTNLAYSAGAGVSYAINKRFSIDLGYRYVDMGNVETGFNTFANRINARDEQLKSKLSSNEVFIGLRGRF
ncbi:outer membrane protein [Burkholderia sp. A2]|uniref:outer membrane protein n=1 Tax=Burkholderia sp. A2 TaxID=236253 RepID=UPI00084BD5EC|nr:outer membrane beta-barrel protein [Burkholderia sp. A2]OED10906.1 porin [Burkholderia sp. A2]RQU05277.1 porin family protein [Burkholderia cenocepacia]RQU12331.1 porin family protein [Burkholderia cenocepacia]